MSTKISTLIAVVVPLVGLVAALYVGCSALDLALFGGMSAVSGLGVTIGYHRYFTHRSFDCPPLIQAVLGAAGSMAIQGPLLWWVATHRVHHRYSDEGGDPHSPHLHGGWRGFWHAHIGWMFDYDIDPAEYTRDLQQMSEARYANRMFPFWVGMGCVIPLAIGGWSGLLWGGLVRWFFVNHVTWSINSVCHLFGRKPFETRDESRNNWLLAIPSFGESWHNNHHFAPGSAKHGFRWYQFDISYWVICLLEQVGLAWNVRRVPDRLLKKMGQK